MPKRRSRRWILVLAVAVVLTAGTAVLFVFLTREPPPQGGEGDGLTVRYLDAAAWPREDGEGLVLRGDRPAELEIESRQRLYALRLDFERLARASLEVEGGRLSERILRPDGSVAFQVIVDEPQEVRHWWRPGRLTYRYRLRLAVPGGAPGPVALTLSAGATVVEEGDS